MAPSLQRIWNVLEEREARRRAWSSTTGQAPENIWYSVNNSRKNRTGNRYSDILAYDRTAVVVDGEYLNANVIQDGRESSWVAAQVS
jgi:protein-tyrosine phosphatase